MENVSGVCELASVNVVGYDVMTSLFTKDVERCFLDTAFPLEGVSPTHGKEPVS